MVSFKPVCIWDCDHLIGKISSYRVSKNWWCMGGKNQEQKDTLEKNLLLQKWLQYILESNNIEPILRHLVSSSSRYLTWYGGICFSNNFFSVVLCTSDKGLKICSWLQIYFTFWHILGQGSSTIVPFASWTILSWYQKI